MAQLAIPALIAGTLMQVSGNMEAAKAADRQGLQAVAFSDYEARQQEQNAGQEQAAAQRKAEIERRNARLVASRALAVAGASGAGASDPTVINAIADLEGEGAYRAGLAIYEGEDRARAMRQSAMNSRTQGQIAYQDAKAQSRAYKRQAWGSVMQGAANYGMYSKYGGGGVKPQQLPAPVEDRFFR